MIMSNEQVKGKKEPIWRTHMLSSDEIENAEKKLYLYPLWKKVLNLIDEMIEADCQTPRCDDVTHGGERIHRAQRIIEIKESHPEYQRILRNINAVDEAFDNLNDMEREFAMHYWVYTPNTKSKVKIIASDMDCDARTVLKWKKKCIAKMIPYLDEADTVLVRAYWAKKFEARVEERENEYQDESQGI